MASGPNLRHQQPTKSHRQLRRLRNGRTSLFKQPKVGINAVSITISHYKSEEAFNYLVLHFRLLPKVLAKAFPYQAVKLELGAIHSKKQKWPNSAVRRFKVLQATTAIVEKRSGGFIPLQRSFAVGERRQHISSPSFISCYRTSEAPSYRTKVCCSYH